MKVLIGYDDSDCSKAALEDLERAGLPSNSEAFVLSVAEVWLPAESDDEPDEPHRKLPASVVRARARAMEAVQATADKAEEAAGELRQRFPEWSVESQGVADSPAWGLLKKSEAWKPDLVVVGSHGHSILGRLVLGSVSQKVLTESRATVRVARGQGRGAIEPVRIVIGYDGSPDSERAIDAVCQRTWIPGSTVHLLTVVDPLVASSRPPLGSGDPEWGDEAFEEEIHWIGDMQAKALERLRTAGLIASAVLREGDPKKILPAEAEEWGADCIVIGARGLKSMERFLLGSVSSAIAARAHCSVEVVR